MGDGSGKRPFWMHQLVEYILGGAMVASGLQSPKPMVPSVIGGVMLVYTASTRGALSAFRIIDRRVHRVVDPLLVLAQIVGAFQPWVAVDDGTKFIMVAIALVHGVVWWGSSFHEKKRPTAAEKAAVRQAAAAASSGDRSTDIGKKAGRAVGTGVNMVRKARANRQS